MSSDFLPQELAFLSDPEHEPSSRMVEALDDLSLGGYTPGDFLPMSALRRHAERRGDRLQDHEAETGLMVLLHRGLLRQDPHGNVAPSGALLQAIQLGALPPLGGKMKEPHNQALDRRVYAISAGGASSRLWEGWKAQSILTVYGPEWDLVPDLRGYPDFTEYAAEYTPRFGRRGIKEDLWKLRDLAPGDIILAIQGQSHVLGWGVVKAPGYHYRQGLGTECHAVHVTWMETSPRNVPRQAGWLKTVHVVDPTHFETWFPDSFGFTPDIATAEAALESVGAFTPLSTEDARDKVMAAIVRRRGQGAFRDALLARFGGRCVVTGCDVPEALEAAHIVPYLGEHTNQPENGLLLRADIHTLFDLGLLNIDESNWTIRLSPRLSHGSYSKLDGSPLLLANLLVPHSGLFQQRRELLGIG